MVNIDELTVEGAERRNYQSRAAALGTVLKVLLSGEPLTFSPHGIHHSITQRICKRLALRGLVKVTRNGWEPSPPLLCPAFLVAGAEC